MAYPMMRLSSPAGKSNKAEDRPTFYFFQSISSYERVTECREVEIEDRMREADVCWWIAVGFGNRHRTRMIGTAQIGTAHLLRFGRPFGSGREPFTYLVG